MIAASTMGSNAYYDRTNTTTFTTTTTTTSSTNPAALYRHSKFFQSFANLELIGLHLHRPGDDIPYTPTTTSSTTTTTSLPVNDSSIIEAAQRLRRTSGQGRSSISSTAAVAATGRRSLHYNTALNSHICENTIRPIARKRNVLIKVNVTRSTSTTTSTVTVKRSHKTSTLTPRNTTMILNPARALSIRGHHFWGSSRRTTTTHTTDSANSIPATMTSAGTATTSSSSGRSRRFLAKVPKLFDFEISFSLKKDRASKVGMPGMLSKRHRKPSTLDFRCMGIGGEGEIPHGGPTMTYPPRINWMKPDIHSDWKKDWFTAVR